jgi:CubicO group peptidase (beta-lactamase class C family)
MKPILILLPLLLLTSCQNPTDKLTQKFAIPMIQWNYTSPERTISSESISKDFNPPAQTGKSVFQAASLSKPVFAWIVLKMATENQLDLDMPIDSSLWKDRIPAKHCDWAKMLTPRIILSHKSGLPNWAASPSSPEWPESILEFRYRPDSIFSYSGEAYALLQKQIELIKGKPLEQIAIDEVFKPLGMTSTSYQWEREGMSLPDYDSVAVDGYNREGENTGQGKHPRANSAYTLRTTADDYSLFLEELAEGEGVARNIREIMFKPHVNAVRYPENHRECDKSIFWGLGVGIEKNEEFGDIIFHWGDNGSFKALFMIIPSTKSRMVYFSNSEKGHDIIRQVSTIFFNNKKPFALEKWINQFPKKD